jgi:hypothetical protein
MAAKSKNQNQEEPGGTGVLVTAAKSLGKVAGKVASLAGVHVEAAKAVGKLPKKDKQRLPRRQKKAMRKSGAAPVM